MEFFGKVKGGLVNFWKGRNFSELGSWSHVKVLFPSPSPLGQFQRNN